MSARERSVCCIENRSQLVVLAIFDEGRLCEGVVATSPAVVDWRCLSSVGEPERVVVAIEALLVGRLVPCSSILRRLADGGTTVPETVVRGSISSPINRDSGSSGKYGMSTK